MVLHHVEKNNLEYLLDEISRIIKPGGILIIREHDTDITDLLNINLLDVLHSYHDTVLNPSLDHRWTDNFKIEANNYNSERYWSEALLKRAFVYKNKPNIKKNTIKNPFGNIITSYIKVA